MQVNEVARNDLRQAKMLGRAHALKINNEKDSYYVYDEYGKIPLAKCNDLESALQHCEELVECVERGELDSSDFYVLRKTTKMVAYMGQIRD